MASAAPQRPSIDIKCLSPDAGNGGARIGRPPQWTDSKARKLARLYVYTTLPLEKIIKAVFPDDSVKKNSAQKTMHKMFGQDPRHLRPANRSEMNTRFKLVHKRSKRGRSGDSRAEQEVGVLDVKGEPYTPALSDTARFSDMEDLRSPQQESIYSAGSDLASPSTLGSISPTGPIYSAFPPAGGDIDLPFPPPARNDTVFSSSTQMSTDSVRRIRSRLSVTTVFAKQVDVLMKRLSISGPNDQAFPSPQRTPSDIPVYRHGYSDPVPHPGLSLPGDFIVARRYVQPCSREKHFSKYLKESRCACWCVIADESADYPDNLYITSAEEEWCDRACHVLNGTVDASYIDGFGNTPLHFFASLESPKGIEMTIYLIESNRSNPIATNKGGQTFLHVLSAAWFSRLDDINGPLYKLLNILWLRYGETSNAVFIRDVYGRTFFHRLARFVHDIHTFTRISQPYTFNVIPRDAFGVTPPGHITDHCFPAPRRTGTTALSPLAEETNLEESTTKSQALFNTLNVAFDDHTIEDAEGRNGLHCLAEIHFEPPSPSTPSSPNPEKKRKRGQSDSSEGPKPVERRLHFLQTLLTQGTTLRLPDVDQYNKAGHTALMTFATHLTDADDKSGQHTGRIFDLLLTHGARIDMRNRDGETALLMAARAGNKNVVSKLLERGANLHARDKNGRGIMGVLDAKIAACAQDRGVSEYGRLEAVRAVLAKVVLEMGGEDEPGFLDEWCRPSRVQA